MNVHTFIPVNKADVFHTSGYAKAAQGANLGATDATTFGLRQQQAKQRTTVAGYNRSRIGASFGVLRAKQSTPTGRNPKDSDASIGSRQASNARSAVSPTRFKNPPSRGYNPYA